MFDENVSSNGINFDFIVIDEPRNVSNKRPKRMPRKQKKYFKKCFNLWASEFYNIGSKIALRHDTCERGTHKK